MCAVYHIQCIQRVHESRSQIADDTTSTQSSGIWYLRVLRRYFYALRVLPNRSCCASMKRLGLALRMHGTCDVDRFRRANTMRHAHAQRVRCSCYPYSFFAQTTTPCLCRYGTGRLKRTGALNSHAYVELPYGNDSPDTQCFELSSAYRLRGSGPWHWTNVTRPKMIPPPPERAR